MQYKSGVLAFALFALGCATAFAQDQAPPQGPPPGPPPAMPPPSQMLSPQQLDDLVAPIALYPDPLLSQIMVAATYPLEVVQAYQWVQRSQGLSGPALTQAAQEQNWDPSVQALVIFPDVLKRLNDDVTWLTNLGNAFLSQQADVMAAVQEMRARAQQAGRLSSTPQEQVMTTQQNGQPVIEIMPANPDVMYVPMYDPALIWGPPLYYPYPRWYWPRPYGAGVYFGFGPAIQVGLFFGGGWGGWGGWGWHPGWGNRTVIVNNTFIHRYNFNSTHINNFNGTSVWSHDAYHRAGVPYSNRGLSDQYRGGVRQNLNPQQAPQQFRGNAGGTPAERFGNRNIQPSEQTRNPGAFSGVQNGSNARTFSDHGYSSLGPSRSAAPQAPQARQEVPQGRQQAPQARQEAPRSAPAPQSRGGGERGGGERGGEHHR